jgi:hypothetical protein
VSPLFEEKEETEKEAWPQRSVKSGEGEMHHCTYDDEDDTPTNIKRKGVQASQSVITIQLP